MFWRGADTEWCKCQTGLEVQFQCKLSRKSENLLPCSFPTPLCDTDDENVKNEQGFMQKGPLRPLVKKISKRSFPSSVNSKL